MSDHTVEESEHVDDPFSRPIIVGYAFGPKKLSTMGWAMAEASKTKFSTTWKSGTTVLCGHTTSFSAEKSNHAPPPHVSPATERTTKSPHSMPHSPRKNTQLAAPQDSVMFSTASGSATDGYHSATGEAADIRNIVRVFRSSCSSVAESLSSGTGTASVSSVSGASLRTSSTPTMGVVSNPGSVHTHYPVRVSFVPLDMESPLEDQHGGQIDVILHKLTEDILCTSQISKSCPELRSLSEVDSMSQVRELLQKTNTPVSPSELDALNRVHRLLQFQKIHPKCSLVDDPRFVQPLMSRSDIATKLQSCLEHVTSASGISVDGPKFVVLQSQEQTLDHALAQNAMNFPVIIKPLIAAGTKASHSMAVMLRSTHIRLSSIPIPCLCQEYINHDSLLYKVYVLGDHVSVHKRRSLPNLPRDRPSRKAVLEFDSQRPYPRLSDFGFEEATSRDSELADVQVRKKQRPTYMTAEELQPVVDALRQAFCLDLFGFDVIVTSSGSQSMEPTKIMVVDVNYFPSYKEVRNFPALLAKYLTDCAIESRKSSAIDEKI